MRRSETKEMEMIRFFKEINNGKIVDVHRVEEKKQNFVEITFIQYMNYHCSDCMGKVKVAKRTCVCN